MSTVDEAPVMPALPEELNNAPLEEQRRWMVMYVEKTYPQLTVAGGVQLTGIPVATYYAIRRQLGYIKQRHRPTRATTETAIAPSKLNDEAHRIGRSAHATQDHQPTTFKELAALFATTQRQLQLVEADSLWRKYCCAVLSEALGRLVMFEREV